EPFPVFREITATGGSVSGVDLGLKVRPTPLPLTFVHGSDTHVGLTTGAETADALRQATALDREPAFVVITGDISDNSLDREFADFDRAVADALTVPLVPVVGTHDGYDYSGNHRHHFGPLNYSFDAGGVHFMTLSYFASAADQISFVKQDLALGPPGQPAVVFMHVPPAPETADAFQAAGVSYLFT